MGRRKVTTEPSKTPDGIEITVMAIREELMQYFKGTCVDRVTRNRNIYVNRIYGSNRYIFERREEENAQRATLSIGKTPILFLQKSPDRVVFYDGVLDRSPQLKEVKAGIEDFMDKYLVAVEKEHSNANIIE